MTPGCEHRSREQEFKWVKSERELKELMTQKNVIHCHLFPNVTFFTKNIINMNEHVPKILKFKLMQLFQNGIEHYVTVCLWCLCRLCAGEGLYHARLHAKARKPLPDTVAAAVFLPVPQPRRVER